MAATSLFVYNLFFNSNPPENFSKKQLEIPEPNQNPRVLIRTGSTNPKPFNKNRPKHSKPAFESRNLSLTRALRSYVDSGCMDNALRLFENMIHVDSYAYNVMIRGFANSGLFQKAINFYYRMERDGFRADNFTYPFVIKACGELLSLIEGEKVHAKLIKCGLDLDVYVCNSLIVMYMKLGPVEYAEKVFDEMTVRDVVSWNSMISGYKLAGDGLKSLTCLKEMKNLGIKHDRFSVISSLGASSGQCCLKCGKEIHSQAIKSGLEMDVMVQTSLIDMYGKCGELGYAEKLFNKILSRNIVTWNAMIGGYTRNGYFDESFMCLKEMQYCDKLELDTISMINILPSCAQLGAFLKSKSIHGYAIRRGFLPNNIVLETALVEMYGEFGKLTMAEYIFDSISEKNLVSWNSMIAAYGQNGKNREALELFDNLRSESLEPDAITLASIVPAYAEIATLSEGMQIHALIIKLGLSSNTYISNSIIYMYAKCGDLLIARIFFDMMMCKDIVSWNIIIMAYAIHGFGMISIELFSEMQKNGVKPNRSTFVSLLTSCSISGLVDEGWYYFNSMKREYSIDPGIEHYGCIVDLLSRKGDLELVKSFIEEMPIVPDARIWGSLLSASRKKNDIVLAEYAAKQILSLEHDNTGCYVLLSNMYAEADRWDDMERIRALMEKEGIAKTVSCSLVEKNGKTYSFVNRDMSHREADTIYCVLDILMRKIGEEVNVRKFTKFKPPDLIRKKEKSPRNHSVRLGICFGLISTSIGKPVIVRNNTRVCEDCHNAAKEISRITRRELIVGEPKVFHHFKDGFCSCGDYW